jgi:hypothetical protein
MAIVAARRGEDGPGGVRRRFAGHGLRKVLARNGLPTIRTYFVPESHAVQDVRVYQDDIELAPPDALVVDVAPENVPDVVVPEEPRSW